MLSISKQKNNTGGISKFYLIPVDEFTSLSVADVNQIRTLVLASTDTTYEIHAIPQSISYSDIFRYAPAGSLYEKQFTAKIAKDTPETAAVLQSLINKKWLLVLQDQNGYWKLAGTQTNPMRFGFSVKPGKAFADLNHYEIKLTGQTPSLAFFIHKPF